MVTIRSGTRYFGLVRFRARTFTAGMPEDADPHDPETIRAAKLQRIDESHRCAPGNCALLVIDMQHGFLDEDASLGLVKWRALIPNIQSLISAARGNHIPVIFTEFVYSRQCGQIGVGLGARSIFSLSRRCE